MGLRKKINVLPDSKELIENNLDNKELCLTDDEIQLWSDLQLYEHFSYQLKDDKSHPLRNCDPKFISSKSFMMKVIKYLDATLLFYASDELQKDQDFLLEAVKSNPLLYKDIPSEHISDKKLVYDTAKSSMLSAIFGDDDQDQVDYFFHQWERDGDYKHTFFPFRNDKEFADEILSQIKHSPKSYFEYFEYLGPELLKDEKFMDQMYQEMADYLAENENFTGELFQFYRVTTTELTDDEIEIHLSGIKKYLKK